LANFLIILWNGLVAGPGHQYEFSPNSLLNLGRESLSLAANQYNIVINNWDTYQPRKDLKSLSWIRIESDIFFTENFFVLDNNQRLLFFFLLTYAGKKNTNAYSINSDFISDKVNLTSAQISSGIEKLQQLSILHSSVTDSSRIRTDLCTTIRNDTNDTIHNITIHDRSADIEKIYAELYPLKKGKQKGVAKLAKELKTDQDIENFKQAVTRYSASIKDPNYIKHFSTFANEWTDWLDKDAGKATITPKVQNAGSRASGVFDNARAQIAAIREGKL